MDIEEYINGRLDEQIKWYSKKSRSAQRWYKVLKGLEIILSGSVTFFTMLLWSCQNGKILVGALGAIVSIIAAWQANFKYREKWLSYRMTEEHLKQEKLLYLTKAGRYANPNMSPANFIENCERIMNDEHDTWEEIYKPNKSQIN